MRQGVQFAGTTELAALGPNAVTFNFTTYLVSALSVAVVTYGPYLPVCCQGCKGESLL